MFEIPLQISWSGSFFDLQKHDATSSIVLIFFYMSIISNYQVRIRFFFTYKKIDVNCLSTFKFAFLVVHIFKLLTKVRNSTKKANVVAFWFSFFRLLNQNIYRIIFSNFYSMLSTTIKTRFSVLILILSFLFVSL